MTDELPVARPNQDTSPIAPARTRRAILAGAFGGLGAWVVGSLPVAAAAPIG